MKQILEKIVLKDWNEYAKIIVEKYEKLPILEQSSIKYWKALNDSNYVLWRRLLSKIDVVFVSEERKYMNSDSNVDILGKNHKIIYWEGGQPYNTQSEMKTDVLKNNRLYISCDHSTHPYFTLTDNIVFRSVHDYITHILGNFQFGLNGELSCYNLHAKLATKEAVPALFTEVVGQVCWAIVKGNFPIQKVAIIEGVDYYNIGKIDNADIKNKKLVNIKKFKDFE